MLFCRWNCWSDHGICFSLFTITACCITAAHTKGRREWNRAGFPTVLGAKAFGILWTAVACLLISFVSLVVLTCLSRTSTRRRNRGVGVTNGSEVTPRGEQETYAKESSGEIPRGEYDQEITLLLVLERRKTL